MADAVFKKETPVPMHRLLSHPVFYRCRAKLLCGSISLQGHIILEDCYLILQTGFLQRYGTKGSLGAEGVLLWPSTKRIALIGAVGLKPGTRPVGVGLRTA